jgi:hypothetical protein
MKKLLLLVLCLVLLLGLAFAKGNKMTGYIVDDQCGAKMANDASAACVKECINEHGAKPVLVTDDKKEVIAPANPDAII